MTKNVKINIRLLNYKFIGFQMVLLAYREEYIYLLDNIPKVMFNELWVFSIARRNLKKVLNVNLGGLSI